MILMVNLQIFVSNTIDLFQKLDIKQHMLIGSEGGTVKKLNSKLIPKRFGKHHIGVHKSKNESDLDELETA